MKNRLLCLCLVLSLCVFAEARAPQKTGDFSEPQTFELNNQIGGSSEIPNVFRPIGNFFKRLFGKKRQPQGIDYMINVASLTLSKTEIIASCSPSNMGQNDSCSDAKRFIEILTEAVNPANDVLTYNYTISGGKIIGEGAKVIWDLSGVKPGTYTITAAADNGCGVCGYTKTKEVKVIECPNCN